MRSLPTALQPPPPHLQDQRRKENYLSFVFFPPFLPQACADLQSGACGHARPSLNQCQCFFLHIVETDSEPSLSVLHNHLSDLPLGKAFLVEVVIVALVIFVTPSRETPLSFLPACAVLSFPAQCSSIRISNCQAHLLLMLSLRSRTKLFFLFIASAKVTANCQVECQLGKMDLALASPN